MLPREGFRPGERLKIIMGNPFLKAEREELQGAAERVTELFKVRDELLDRQKEERKAHYRDTAIALEEAKQLGWRRNDVFDFIKAANEKKWGSKQQVYTEIWRLARYLPKEDELTAEDRSED
jgi:hypothetical protein